jgi:hypothetical protein
MSEIETFGNNNDFWIFGYGYAYPTCPRVVVMFSRKANASVLGA